jgi:hypothetical protein
MPKSAATGENQEAKTMRPQTLPCCVPLIESGQGLILGHLRRTDFGSHRLELKQFYLLLYGPCPK